MTTGGGTYEQIHLLRMPTSEKVLVANRSVQQKIS